MGLRPSSATSGTRTSTQETSSSSSAAAATGRRCSPGTTAASCSSTSVSKMLGREPVEPAFPVQPRDEQERPRAVEGIVQQCPGHTRSAALVTENALERASSGPHRIEPRARRNPVRPLQEETVDREARPVLSYRQHAAFWPGARAGRKPRVSSHPHRGRLPPGEGRVQHPVRRPADQRPVLLLPERERAAHEVG